MAQINAIHITRVGCMTPERAEEYLRQRQAAEAGREAEYFEPSQVINRYVQGPDVIEISFGPIETWMLEDLFNDDANPINDALLGRTRRKPKGDGEFDNSLLPTSSE